MRPFDRQRIPLGVTGGIASYKAAWLARLLTQAGAEVDVVLTRAASAPTLLVPAMNDRMWSHPQGSGPGQMPEPETILAHCARLLEEPTAVDTNRGTIVHADGREERLPLQGKTQVADEIRDRVEALLHGR